MKENKKLVYSIALFSLISCKQMSNPEETTTPAVANPYPTGGISLLSDPGLNNPRMRFHDGTVVNNQPHILEYSPEIPNFPESSWYVSQWKKTEILRPEMLVENPENFNDPFLGHPRYSFTTSDNQSHVWIFKHPTTEQLVFELYGQHGWLDTGGGSNVFISSELLPNVSTTLENRIDLNFRAKISKRTNTYLVNGADRDGSVVSQFISGFTLQYRDPTNGQVTGIFLQINHADSRNPKYLAPGTLEYRGCYINDFGQRQIVYGNNMPNSLGGNGFIAGEDSTGDLKNYSYNINRQICTMVKSPIKCQDGSTFQFPKEAKDLANWNVSSFYTGIETQDAFAQSSNVIPTVRGADRGFTAFGIQLADLKLMKYPSEPTPNCDGTPAPVPAPTPAPAPAPTPAPVENSNSGSFCSNNVLIKWQCGLSTSPGSDWSSVGSGCYHKNTGMTCPVK